MRSPTRARSHCFGQLRRREAVRSGGQSHHGVHHVSVAGFIQIHARQSPGAAQGRLRPPLERPFVQEAHVGHLHRVQKAPQHPGHAFQQFGQFLQHLAALERLGIMHHHLHPQHPLALVVDLQGQVAPLDFEHGQVVARRLHHFDHLRPRASPL